MAFDVSLLKKSLYYKMMIKGKWTKYKKRSDILFCSSQQNASSYIYMQDKYTQSNSFISMDIKHIWFVIICPLKIM